VKLRW